MKKRIMSLSIIPLFLIATTAFGGGGTPVSSSPTYTSAAPTYSYGNPWVLGSKVNTNYVNYLDTTFTQAVTISSQWSLSGGANVGVAQTTLGCTFGQSVTTTVEQKLHTPPRCQGFAYLQYVYAAYRLTDSKGVKVGTATKTSLQASTRYFRL